MLRIDAGGVVAGPADYQSWRMAGNEIPDSWVKSWLVQWDERTTVPDDVSVLCEIRSDRWIYEFDLLLHSYAGLLIIGDFITTSATGAYRRWLLIKHGSMECRNG